MRAAVFSEKADIRRAKDVLTVIGPSTTLIVSPANSQH